MTAWPRAAFATAQAMEPAVIGLLAGGVLPGAPGLPTGTVPPGAASLPDCAQPEIWLALARETPS